MKMPMPKSAELFYDIPLTDEQKKYANSCHDNIFTGCKARSGSGKTTVAVGVAKLRYEADKKNRVPLHYIFPTVEEGALGFTTGDVAQKESKYLIPLKDALVAIGEDPSRAIISPINEKYDTSWVHAYSHNYMRGGNIMNATVIIDEAQNLTKAELRKILTRCHDSCHVILIGDPNQCDIDPKKSGFIDYLNHYSTESYAFICELTRNFRGRLSAHAETL